jgi:hypothetical protein
MRSSTRALQRNPESPSQIICHRPADSIPLKRGQNGYIKEDKWEKRTAAR